MRVARLVLVAAALTGPVAAADAPTPCRVLRVVDGDTVIVDDGGPVTIRLIGVDAPESVHPRRPVEPFGRESAAFLRDLLKGRGVTLEFEPGTDFDRYGRTLAYLVRDDGLAVNREMVARGYAHVYTRFPFRRMEDFRSAEREARAAGRGLWGSTAPAQDEAVYVTPTGRRYHRQGCRSAGVLSASMTLGDLPRGLTPCRVCSPAARVR